VITSDEGLLIEAVIIPVTAKAVLSYWKIFGLKMKIYQ